MASTTSVYFPLATEFPYTGGQDTSAGNPNAGAEVDSTAGAAGNSPGAVEISRGAIIAIVVVVCAVGIVGSKPPSTMTDCRIHANRAQFRALSCSTSRRRGSGRSVRAYGDRHAASSPPSRRGGLNFPDRSRSRRVGNPAAVVDTMTCRRHRDCLSTSRKVW